MEDSRRPSKRKQSASGKVLSKKTNQRESPSKKTSQKLPQKQNSKELPVTLQKPKPEKPKRIKKQAPLRVNPKTPQRKKTGSAKAVPHQKVREQDSKIREQKKAQHRKQRAVQAAKQRTQKRDKSKDSKGRVFRSIRERSRLPLLISVLVCIILAAGFWWYQQGEPLRVVETLHNFEPPSSTDGFNIKNHLDIVAVVNLGVEVVPLLLQKYPQMSNREKLATIIVFGEFADEQSLPLLIEAMRSDNARLAAFACLSASKFGEVAVARLKSAYSKFPEKNRHYLMKAIAKTKLESALKTLLNFAASTDAKTRALAIGHLTHFGELTKVVRCLLEALKDKNASVVEKAIATIHQLQKNRQLEKNAQLVIQHTTNQYQNLQQPSLRARMLRVAAIAAITHDGKYIEGLRSKMREALASNAPEEIAAAAYGLGLFEDSEEWKRLLALLDSEHPLITSNVAFALNRFNDPEIINTILQGNWANSKKQHVLGAIAEILENYLLYVIRLGLREKALRVLQQALQNASDKEIINSIEKTKSLYEQKIGSIDVKKK